MNLDGCTAGTIYIQPQSTSALVDVPGTIALGESARNVYVYGPANNKGIKIKVTGKSAQFGPVCDTTNPGTVYLKSGTDLNATDFACGNVVSKPARGHMIIEEGAKVTVRNRFMNAYWSGVPGSRAVSLSPTAPPRRSASMPTRSIPLPSVSHRRSATATSS